MHITNIGMVDPEYDNKVSSVSTVWIRLENEYSLECEYKAANLSLNLILKFEEHMYKAMTMSTYRKVYSSRNTVRS